MERFKLVYEKTYGYLSSNASKEDYSSTIEAETLEAAVQKAERKLFKADFTTTSSVTEAFLILPNGERAYIPRHSKTYVDTTTKIFEVMKTTAQEASILLLDNLGKTPNIGKDTDSIPGMNDRTSGTALTFLDPLIQEILLENIYSITSTLDVNAEENTPHKNKFKSCKWLTIHCDPLDNTSGYIQGNENFSSGYALSDILDRFTHTVVIAPMRGKMYTASPDGCDIITTKTIQKTSQECTLRTADINTILSRGLLSEKGELALRKAGFTIAGLRGAHLSVIDVALNNVGALLYGVGNVHDVLLPYAFAKVQNAELVNAKGQPIVGKRLLRREEGSSPLYERVPSACYFGSAFSKKNIVLDILSSDVNLHQAYLLAREREE